MDHGVIWEAVDLTVADEFGEAVERQNLARRSFAPPLTKAELTGVRFRDLRYTSASLLLRLGEHPKVVQERLGHSTITTTMDIYSHVMPDLQKEAASKLDRIFSTS